MASRGSARRSPRKPAAQLRRVKRQFDRDMQDDGSPRVPTFAHVDRHGDDEVGSGRPNTAGAASPMSPSAALFGGGSGSGGGGGANPLAGMPMGADGRPKTSHLPKEGLLVPADAGPDHRYMDSIALTGHMHGAPLAQTGTVHSLLLMQPVSVPDLGHTGVDGSALSPPPRGAQARYPRVSGTSSGRHSLRESIVTSIRTKVESNRGRLADPLDHVPITKIDDGRHSPTHPARKKHPKLKFEEPFFDPGDLLPKKGGHHPRVPSAVVKSPGRRRKRRAKASPSAQHDGADGGLGAAPNGAGGIDAQDSYARDSFEEEDPATREGDGDAGPRAGGPSAGAAQVSFAVEDAPAGDESAPPQLDFDPESEEAKRSVLKIQSISRGKRDRQRVQRLKDEREARKQEAAAAARRDEPVELDFDPDSEEGKKSVLKIQSIQRGRKARRETAERKRLRQEEEARRRKVREDAEAVELDFDPDDPEAQKSILKIQAIQRGRNTRRAMASKKRKEDRAASRRARDAPSTLAAPKGGGVVLDFDPDSEEGKKSVLKIQSIQRGRKARRETAERKRLRQEEEARRRKVREDAEAVELDFDPDDPEAQKSILKIQAIQRGRNTRRAMASKKRKEDRAASSSSRSRRTRGSPTKPSTPQGKASEDVQLDFDPDSEEGKKSVLKIQSIQRGRKARREAAERKRKQDELEARRRKIREDAEAVELDFDPDDPEAQKSILKIQAIQRGRNQRRALAAKKRKEDRAAARRARGASPSKHPRSPKPPAAAVELDFDPDSEEGKKSVLKIQSIQRGRKARREAAERKRKQDELEARRRKIREDAEAVELDFDPDDPEAQKSILKIQAIQRGRNQRRALAAKKRKEDREKAKASRASAFTRSSDDDEYFYGDKLSAMEKRRLESSQRHTERMKKSRTKAQELEATHTSASFRKKKEDRLRKADEAKRLQRQASMRIQSVARAMISLKRTRTIRLQGKRHAANLQLASAAKGLLALQARDFEQIMIQCDYDAEIRTKTVATLQACFLILDDEFDWHTVRVKLHEPGFKKGLVIALPAKFARSNPDKVDKLTRLVQGHHLEAVATSPACPALRLLAAYVNGFVATALLHLDPDHQSKLEEGARRGKSPSRTRAAAGAGAAGSWVSERDRIRGAIDEDDTD